MPPANKFMFDMEFAANKRAENDGEEQIWDVPPREADLNTARDEGFRAGHAAGRAEAEAESSRMQGQALQKFAEAFQSLKAVREQSLQHHAREAVKLALAVAEKLVPSLIAAQPVAEIEAILTDCLSRMMGENRIVIRVHDSLLDELQIRIDELAQRVGFDGQVILLGEPDIAPGDCRVEWADGGTERDVASLTDQINQAVDRLLSAEMPEPANTLMQETPEHQPKVAAGAAATLRIAT